MMEWRCNFEELLISGVVGEAELEKPLLDIVGHHNRSKISCIVFNSAQRLHDEISLHKRGTLREIFKICVQNRAKLRLRLAAAHAQWFFHVSSQRLR